MFHKRLGYNAVHALVVHLLLPRASFMLQIEWRIRNSKILLLLCFGLFQERVCCLERYSYVALERPHASLQM